MAHNRLICERAVYDWSFNDPRTLVYFQQQRMRAHLLDKAAVEASRHRGWITCLSSVASTIRVTWTSRATAVASAAQQGAAPARLVPSAA
jgi:hypothetical protein